MPVLGSSAYSQAGQVTQAARSLLNDVHGNVFSDIFLLPYLNLAYNDLWIILENNGQETFISDEVFLTVPAVNGVDPSAQVIIQDTSVLITQAPGGTVAFVNPGEAGPPNTLPVDLIQPLQLWERQAGSPSFTFVRMENRSGMGGLPSIPQGEYLGFWEWREDGLAFIGALIDVQIRMRYEKMLAPASDGTSQILVRNGLNFLAYKTARLAAMSRTATEGLGAALKPDEAEAEFQLINSAARRGQENPRRRIGYGARTRRKRYGAF